MNQAIIRVAKDAGVWRKHKYRQIKKTPEKLNSYVNELQSLCEMTIPSGKSEN